MIVRLFKTRLFRNSIKILKRIKKYELYNPNVFLRIAYMSFYKSNRYGRSLFFIARNGIVELGKGSQLNLLTTVHFGWRDISKSKMETVLKLSENANVTFGNETPMGGVKSLLV